MSLVIGFGDFFDPCGFAFRVCDTRFSIPWSDACGGLIWVGVCKGERVGLLDGRKDLNDVTELQVFLLLNGIELLSSWC